MRVIVSKKSKPQALDARTLARANAAALRSRGVELAKYVLCPLGLASDTVGDVTVDGEIALIQSHPYPDIYLCPRTGKPQPTESVAWYYADCIAYEHDIPVIVLPTRGDFERFGYRYALGGSRPQTQFVTHVDSGRTTRRSIPGFSTKSAVTAYYAEQLLTILSEVREIRQGPLTYILFRHGASDAPLDLPFSKRYVQAAQELHLYSVALRQADALGEFLCYYRVIESAAHSNHKAWVTAALDRLGSHDFGQIQIGRDFEPRHRRRNLLGIWRRRALLRLSALRKHHGSTAAIAKYLYNTNRCGIAHGNEIVRADITPSYFDVVRDTYVLKLLARLAIDERVAGVA
jgi:hypothetical protein